MIVPFKILAALTVKVKSIDVHVWDHPGNPSVTY